MVRGKGNNDRIYKSMKGEFMKQVKAIFFDVDATLYTHRIHDVPASTLQALQTLKNKGYKIGIATSRCRYETKHLPNVLKQFPFDACIYDGGALIFTEDTCIRKISIDENIVQHIIQTCKDRIPVRYATYDYSYISQPCDTNILDMFFKLYLNYPMIKSYEGEDVYNILLYPRNKEEMQALITQYEDVVQIVEHSQYELEITSKGLDKSNAITYLCKQWNIDMQEIICFGDGANDVGMLKKAGIGVAMGNGNPKAKAAANLVCKDIEEDGIFDACITLGLFTKEDTI